MSGPGPYDQPPLPELKPENFNTKDVVEINLKWVSGLYKAAIGNALWYYGEEKQFQPLELLKLQGGFKPSMLLPYSPHVDAAFWVHIVFFFIVFLAIQLLGCAFCCRTGCKCCCKQGRDVLYWGRRRRVGVAMSQPGGVNAVPSTQPSILPSSSSVKGSAPVDVESAGNAAEPLQSEGTFDESARVDTQNTGEAAQSQGTLKESGPVDTANSGVVAGQPQGIRRSLQNGMGKVQGLLKGREALVLTVLMGFWLLLWFIVIIYSFGAPIFSKNAVEKIDKVINEGFEDAKHFLDVCDKQMEHIYVTQFDIYENKIKALKCEDVQSAQIKCKKLLELVWDKQTCPPPTYYPCTALQGAQESLKEGTVKEFQSKLKIVKDQVGGQQEMFRKSTDAYVKPATLYLYNFLVVINIVSLFSFLAILTGLILAWVGKSDAHKTWGLLAMRGGITALFTLPMFMWLFMIIIFALQGTLSARFCPNFVLAGKDTSSPYDMNANGTYNGSYLIPTYAQVMGSCKNDETSYKAFHLFSIQSPEAHRAKIQEYEDKFNETRTKLADRNTNEPNKAVLEAYMDGIIDINQEYIMDFIVPTVSQKAGKCRIGYNALYSLISLACIELPGPMLGYWFLLQFVPFLFIGMIATAYFFERLHFK